MDDPDEDPDDGLGDVTASGDDVEYERGFTDGYGQGWAEGEAYGYRFALSELAGQA